MVRETLGLPTHLRFREPLPLLKNLGIAFLMRLRRLPPPFFRVIRRGATQTAAGFRHLETWWGFLFCGLLVIRCRLQSFLSSVELRLPSFFTSKPTTTE